MFSDCLYISGLTLKRTCYASPEQYDVYLGGLLFGYLRLRHGSFTAQYLSSSGDVVYYGYPKGDGIFNTTERMHYLKEACAALIDYHNNKVIQYMNDIE